MINGKVARILSDTEVILNVGREHDVKRGMEFVIFSEGEHIFDPETGEDLGPLETVKGRVEITHVMEKMSRAKTSAYQVRTPSVAEQVATGALFGAHTRTRRRKLEVTPREIRSVDEDRAVRVGDKVRSV